MSEVRKEQLKVIKGNMLVDGNGGEPIKDAVIVTEGKRIKEVGSEKQIHVPTGAEVIDMGDCTLMPGLIDCHIHISAPNILTFKNYMLAEFETTPELRVLYALLHAQICFEMGLTTLRDLTWLMPNDTNNTAEVVAIRDAISAGIFPGPRILAGGSTSITNSHLALMLPGTVKLQGVVADGPWELRKLVRTNLRAGCDFIKTNASGGGGSDKEAPNVRNMTQEELNAVVDEAHAFGKPCACHCFTPESQRMAVRAGVDTIEHCVFTDDETLMMMKEANKVIVPTLVHRSDRSIEGVRRTGAPEFVVSKMKTIQPYTKESFQRIHQAGIKIAMGTDVGLGARMDASAYELEIYVNYGMTPMEAIQTATKNAAEAIWLGKDTGTLDAGKFADVIAVDGNPLEDICILQDRKNIRVVMKEGKVYVDKRKGHEKYVMHDQDWNWKISN